MNALAHMFARMGDDLRVEDRLVREFARVTCEEAPEADREVAPTAEELAELLSAGAFVLRRMVDPEIPF